MRVKINFKTMSFAGEECKESFILDGDIDYIRKTTREKVERRNGFDEWVEELS